MQEAVSVKPVLFEIDDSQPCRPSYGTEVTDISSKNVASLAKNLKSERTGSSNGHKAIDSSSDISKANVVVEDRISDAGKRVYPSFVEPKGTTLAYEATEQLNQAVSIIHSKILTKK